MHSDDRAPFWPSPGGPQFASGRCAADGDRKIFPSREACRAWLKAREALERELRAHVTRIDAELAAKRKPA